MSDLKNVQFCPDSAAKQARVSRNKLIMTDIKNGLKSIDIAKNHGVSIKTVNRIYQAYIEDGFLFDCFADFLTLKKNIKKETAFQGITKIISDQLKNKNTQAPAVTVNVNNNLPDQMKIQLNELIQTSEQVCSNHPANQPQKLTLCLDTPLPEDNKPS